VTVKSRNLLVPVVQFGPWPFTRETLRYVRERTEAGYTENELAAILRWELSTLRSRCERHGYVLKKMTATAV